MKRIAIIAYYSDGFFETVQEVAGQDFEWTKEDQVRKKPGDYVEFGNERYYWIQSLKDAEALRELDFSAVAVDITTEDILSASEVSRIKQNITFKVPNEAKPEGHADSCMIMLFKREGSWSCNIEPGPMSRPFTTVEMLTALSGMLQGYWQDAKKEYAAAMGIPLPLVDMKEVQEWIDFQKEAGF